MSFFGRLRRLLTPRFSLRTLLIVMTLLCVGLAFLYPRLVYMSRIRAIRAQGVNVIMEQRRHSYLPATGQQTQVPDSFAARIDWLLGDGLATNVGHVQVSPGNFHVERHAATLKLLKDFPKSRGCFPLTLIQPIDSEKYSELRGHAAIGYIQVTGFAIDAELGDLIASLPNCVTLHVSNVPAGGLGLANMPRPPKLEQLFFNDASQLTPSDYAAIGSYSALFQLHIPNAKLSAADVAAIGKLSQLVQLHCDQTSFIGPHPQRLAPWNGLQELQILSMKKSNVTDHDIASLGMLPNLVNLSLGGNRFTDAALPHFANFPDLQNLGISHAALSDEAFVKTCPPLPKLATISLYRVPISGASLKVLQKQAPLLQSADVGGTKVNAQEILGLRFQCTLTK